MYTHCQSEGVREDQNERDMVFILSNGLQSTVDEVSRVVEFDVALLLSVLVRAVTLSDTDSQAILGSDLLSHW